MNKGDYEYNGPLKDDDPKIPIKQKQSWDERYMDVAKLVATWSKDKSVCVGAVIVKNNRIVATGYNGFPERVDDNVEERHERPAKYEWTVHAEENAILSAARNGIPTDGATMYCTWFPCAPCARKIVNSGINKIVCGQEPDMENEKFGVGFAIVLDMLGEADVEIAYQLEKRVFTIDVGNMSEEDMEKYIQDVAIRFKKHNPISATLKDADGDLHIPVRKKCGCSIDCECKDGDRQENI